MARWPPADFLAGPKALKLQGLLGNSKANPSLVHILSTATRAYKALRGIVADSNIKVPRIHHKGLKIAQTRLVTYNNASCTKGGGKALQMRTYCAHNCQFHRSLVLPTHALVVVCAAGRRKISWMGKR